MARPEVGTPEGSVVGVPHVDDAGVELGGVDRQELERSEPRVDGVGEVEPLAGHDPLRQLGQQHVGVVEVARDDEEIGVVVLGVESEGVRPTRSVTASRDELAGPSIAADPSVDVEQDVVEGSALTHDAHVNHVVGHL